MNTPLLLDVRKLLCPLPVIRLQQMLQTLSPNTRVTVLATDPGVLYDIPTFCRMYQHQIVEIAQTPKEIRIEVLVSPT